MNCEEAFMTWETPAYTVIDVCAEVTGYHHQG
ncbi:pyrroloquinoline quinone precursor peptide PqqA [Saccharopolyspora flava]|nr:pyrroloquinoline quinone precursor peptide PqqA [Saccharopolyspora flava]